MIKKFVYTFLLGLLFVFCVNAQNINKISTRCPSPNQNVYSSVFALLNGNIVHTPCPTKASVFTGNVDFTGATITGIVSGTGTTNYIPRWTNGASGVLGNTPLSWNGTTYTFQNTALNSTFPIAYSPVSGSGTFALGQTTSAALVLNQANKLTEINGATFGANDTYAKFDSASGSIAFNAGASTYQLIYASFWEANAATADIGTNDFTINNFNNFNAQFKLHLVPSVAAGLFQVGDCFTTPTTCITANQTTDTITIAATTVSIPNFQRGAVLSCPTSNLTNIVGTFFVSPTQGTSQATEGNASFPVTRSGTIRNLYVRTGGTAKTNTPTTVITIRKNGSDQAVTLTMTETINTTTSDAINSFTVAAGDLITVKIVVSGAGAVSTSIAAISFELD